jgi:hypothetical protein
MGNISRVSVVKVNTYSTLAIGLEKRSSYPPPHHIYLSGVAPLLLVVDGGGGGGGQWSANIKFRGWRYMEKCKRAKSDGERFRVSHQQPRD